MAQRPKILVTSRDMDRLEALLAALPEHGRIPGRAELEAELARADVVAPDAMPGNVVTMNSTVRFLVEGSRDEFRLTLVYPNGMDDSGTTISILAPVGSALLGLAEGDEIEWPKPGGGSLKVRIEEVLEQPERSGDFTR